jgi:hypothetical protein
MKSAKPGAEYERFVYAKLRALFPDAVVSLNERIFGRESKIEREIDVALRFRVVDTDLLYIVQCKDWTTKVDINTLGAFSAVMQDVGAAKGFLLCSSGFYETNFQYALARGIELVTIEDINSNKWRVEIQVPLVYVRNFNNFKLTMEIVPNAALIALNRDRDLELRLTTKTPIRTSSADTPVTFEQYVLERVKRSLTDFRDGMSVDLTTADLELLMAGVWIRCAQLALEFSSTKTYFLKYLTPTEYSQLRDHVRGVVLPLHCRLEDLPFELDGSFIETSSDAVSAFPGLHLEVVESNLDPEQWVRLEPRSNQIELTTPK